MLFSSVLKSFHGNNMLVKLAERDKDTIIEYYTFLELVKVLSKAVAREVCPFDYFTD